MIDVIPLIDIQAGRVVQPRLGDPNHHQPLQTSLARTSTPPDVVAGLLRLHPFRQIYVADLDAICGKPTQTYTLAALETLFPDIAFWVDNGARDDASLRSWLTHRRGLVILGTETQKDAALLARYRDTERVVLSLDFRGEAGIGAADIFEQPSLWPSRVIVTTLARIGSGAGPDLAKLRAIKACAGSRAVYAAGGVRDAQDLEALREAGIAGALVASTLLDRQSGQSDLAGGSPLWFSS